MPNMPAQGYLKTQLKIRGQLVTLCYRDFGLVSDDFNMLRVVDWHTEENFEFEEGEELDVEEWLIKHIDGELVGMHLETLHSVEFGDGE